MNRYADWDEVAWEVAKTAALRTPDNIPFETLVAVAHDAIHGSSSDLPNLSEVRARHLADLVDLVVHKVLMALRRLTAG